MLPRCARPLRARLFSSISTTINAGALTIEPTTSPKPRTEASKLVFGKTTTDHMLDIDWTASAVGFAVHPRAAFICASFF